MLTFWRKMRVGWRIPRYCVKDRRPDLGARARVSSRSTACSSRCDNSKPEGSVSTPICRHPFPSALSGCQVEANPRPIWYTSRDTQRLEPPVHHCELPTTVKHRPHGHIPSDKTSMAAPIIARSNAANPPNVTIPLGGFRLEPGRRGGAPARTLPSGAAPRSVAAKDCFPRAP